MSPNVDVLGGLAERWWACVFHATWQASLVAIVLLAVVWSWRRLSSPLRYALLLVVLVKFLMPPMLAAPTGAFSRLGPIAEAPALWNGRRLTEWEFDRRANAPGSASSQIGPEAGRAPAQGNGSTQAAPVPADGVLRRGAPMTPSLTHGTATRRISWPSWLMLLHGLGCLAVAAWIVGHWYRLARLCHAAEQVASGPLHDELARLSQKLGLRWRVRLLTARGAPAPMAFGLVRPTVLIPAATLEELPREELSAILAHELAHHRRWDPWFNCLQIAVSVVWWFNPLVWVLNRAIRSTREDCCDDLILHGRLTTRGVYGESLLRLAKLLSRSPALRRTPRFAHSMHPLRRRLIRVMDNSTPRATGVSLAGCVVVAIVAALVLPGLSMRADEPDPAEQGESPPPATADAGQQPAAAPTVTRAGTVTDPDGNPLAGVRVRSHSLVSLLRKPIFDEAHTVTDDEGRFRMAGLRRWERLGGRDLSDENQGQRRLVFEHPDFAVTSFEEERARGRYPEFDFEAIHVQLLEQTSFSGVVTDEQGQPVSGAAVGADIQEIRGEGTPGNITGVFSSDLWYPDPITTDERGRFVIEKLPVFSMLHIRVTRDGFATYDSRNELRGEKRRGFYFPFYAGDHDLEVRLSPAATIRGRLIRDGRPVRRKGVRIGLKDPSGSLVVLPSATTDGEGRYELSGLSEGVYAVYAGEPLLSEGGLVCMPALEVEAKGGSISDKTDLICSEGTLLTGRVTESESGRPLSGRGVSVHLGEPLNIILSMAKTDEQGTYRLHVPVGDWTVGTYEWREGRLFDVSREISIPAEGPVPSVDFTVATRPEFPCRLVDQAGRPVAGTLAITSASEPIETDEHGTCRFPELWGHPTPKPTWKSGYAFNRDKTLGVSFWWISGDREQVRRLVLRPVGTVRGRIVDRLGKPAADAKASIQLAVSMNTVYSPWSRNPPYEQELQADGTFEFRRVPLPEKSGLVLHVRDSGYTTSHGFRWKYKADVEIDHLEPGETLDLGDVVLEER